MTDNTSILKQVTALPDMSLAELKVMWKELYDQQPPAHRKPYLVRRLAYRIQELAFGGLTEATEKRLDTIGQGKDDPQSKGNAGGKRRKKVNTPGSGARLVREWNGKEYVVMVLDNGFEYQGQTFKSLSAIAREITGTQWSGPVFFGLKKNGGGK
jgi:hypothetical protein